MDGWMVCDLLYLMNRQSWQLAKLLLLSLGQGAHKIVSVDHICRCLFKNSLTKL